MSKQSYCKDCGGTGWDEYHEHVCGVCKGTGEGNIVDEYFTPTKQEIATVNVFRSNDETSKYFV